MTPQLMEYIKNERAKGVADKDIRLALRTSGWQESDIQKALDTDTSFHRNGRRFSHRALLVALVIGGILLAGGASAFFYYQQVVSPEAVIKRMITGTSNITSFEYSGDVSVQLDISKIQSSPFLQNAAGFLKLSQQPQLPAQPIPLHISFSGSIDSRNPAQVKGSLLINLNIDIGSRQRYSVALETRMVDNVVYVKLNDFPNLGSDASAFLHKWIKVDIKKLADQYNLKDLKLQLEQTNTSPQLTKEQVAQMQEAFIKNHVFTDIKELAGDTIEGKAVHHYTFSFNTNGLLQYLNDISGILKTKGFNADELARIKNSLSSFQAPSNELWVGKDDFLLYRSKFVLTMRDTKNAQNLGEVTFNIKAKNFNQPIEVTLPAESVSLDEITAKAMQQSQQSLIKNRDAKRISDLQSLNIALALYHSDKDKYPAHIQELVPTYLRVVSSDPFDHQPSKGVCDNAYTPSFPGTGYAKGDYGYGYDVNKNGKNYALHACLEDSTNRALISDCSQPNLLPRCFTGNIYDAHS